MLNNFLLHIDILWPALLAGFLVLATHIPFGQEVLKRGIIFLDLAIAQVAAFGLMISKIGWFDEVYFLSPLEESVIASGTAILGAMFFYGLRRFAVKTQEAMIGVVYILAATGCVLLLSAQPHAPERLKEILVGQILWVQPKDLVGLSIISGVILMFWFGARHRLGDWVFYPLFALTVTLSTQLVGIYLVFSSLIIPALVTLGQKGSLLHAFIIGASGYFFGLLVAAFYDLPAGAAVVWALAVVAGLYWCYWRFLHQHCNSH
jgi:zinc/manganese transport system permease protein